MNRYAVCLLVAVAVAASICAQQPNQPGRARMTFNSSDGPPFPIPVSMPRGQVILVPNSCNLEGLPNSPFVVAGANAVLPAGVPFLGGLIDLAFYGTGTGFAVAVDGTTNPIWSIGPVGTFTAPIVLPANAQIGAQRAFQGMVADFTAPTGVSFTAASILTVAQGVTTQVLSIGSNSYTSVNLTQYNVSLPFYANTYSQIFVQQDGTVSFNSGGSGDFTPTPAEFLTEMPRIAGMWTDLEPGGSSVINLQVDQSQPQLAFVQVNWINMVEWAGTGSPHTFSIRIYAAPIGDINIIQGLFNNAAQYDILVGLSPGGNLSTITAHPQKNLSNLNTGTTYWGCVNENYHEWYGLLGFPYYTAGFNNPWDLTGRTLTFLRYQPGTVPLSGCTGSATGWGYYAP